jgi:hypothetical protein
VGSRFSLAEAGGILAEAGGILAKAGGSGERFSHIAEYLHFTHFLQSKNVLGKMRKYMII